MNILYMLRAFPRLLGKNQHLDYLSAWSNLQKKNLFLVPWMRNSHSSQKKLPRASLCIIKNELPFFLLSWKAGLDGWGKMWSQFYIILSSSFEGRSLSLLFLSPAVTVPTTQCLIWAWLCSATSLWIFLLSHTSCLPSHPSSFSHHIMFCCSPFPAMQHGGLPNRDTPLSDGECGIYLGGAGAGCTVVCFREQSKGSTWEEVAGTGVGESSVVWGRWRRRADNTASRRSRSAW